MEPITVQRVNLILIVKGNRDRHIGAHKTALNGWRVKQIDAIKKESAKAMKLACAGKQAGIHLHLAKPKSYVEEYDRVLGMLMMDTSATVKLDATDYDRYVKDKWEWAEAFAGSTMMYSKVKVKR